MYLKNTEKEYGWVAIFLHWLVAISIFCTFALGLWMIDLEYYDSWYKQAPFVHKSTGIVLLILMLFRLIWRLKNVQPKPEPNLKPIEIRVSKWVHYGMYALFFMIAISGYLISTADGRPISVFGLFEVPATLSDIESQEDVAGEVHEILAFTLIFFVSLHFLGACKHHFIDKDRTLRKMLGIPPKNRL